MKRLIFIFILIFTVTSSYSQKVGVVLSGGGAKGLYHIGIIKALEENNIPIDYIAGTSMGSIIAGLYAAGYSYKDMIYLFTNDDVENWVTGKIANKYKNYFNEENLRPELFSAKIDLKKIFKFEKSRDKSDRGMFHDTPLESITAEYLISSMILDVELMGYLASANAHSKGNFDNLFVPFRCVAADIQNKNQFIWRNGDLARAIRSSMAIPILFSPVVVDDKILYDGGMYNNFPWKVAEKEFEPDFIIGGRCVTSNSPSTKSIVGQLELMIMHHTDYDIPKDKGIVIGRSVDNGLLDFDDPIPTIEKGYNDAMLLMDSIKMKIKRRVDIEDVQRRRLEYKSKLPILAFSPESVESLNGIENKNKKLRNIKSDTLFIDTENLSRSSTEDNMGHTYSFNGFKNIFFRTIYDRDMKADFPTAEYNPQTGLFDLNVRLTSTPVFNIKGGINISSSSINQAYLGLNYQNNKKSVGEYAIDGYLGSFYSSANISTRHTFYKRKIPFYVGLSFIYNYTDYYRANNQRLALNSLSQDGEYRSHDTYISGEIGIKIRKTSKAELRIATGRETLKFSDRAYSNEIIYPDKADVRYYSAYLAIKSNTQNYKAFSTRGTKNELSGTFTVGRTDISSSDSLSNNELEVRYIGRRENWINLQYKREQYIHLSKIFNIGYKVDAAWTNVGDMGNDYVTRAFSPRYTPTHFSRTLFLPEFQHKSYVALGVMPIFELNEKVYLKTGAFVYKKDILQFKKIIKDLKYIFDASLVYQSPIGPISFSYNHFDVSSAKKNYFIFSFGYMIMNKRGVTY